MNLSLLHGLSSGMALPDTLLRKGPNPAGIGLPDTFKEGPNPRGVGLPDTFKEGPKARGIR